MGWAYVLKRDFNSALKYSYQAIEINEDVKWYQLNLAYALYFSGEKQIVLNHIRQIIDENHKKLILMDLKRLSEYWSNSSQVNLLKSDLVNLGLI